MARPRQERPAIVTVPLYLSAVQSMHGLALADMARALRVNPSVARRWRRGTLVPTWSRLKAMTALWGGDAELLALGAALQRFCKHTGVPLDDAVRMVRQGRRTAPTRRSPQPVRDRHQLPLL